MPGLRPASSQASPDLAPASSRPRPGLCPAYARAPPGLVPASTRGMPALAPPCAWARSAVRQLGRPCARPASAATILRRPVYALAEVRPLAVEGRRKGACMSASIDRREFLARTALGAAALAVPLPVTQTASGTAGMVPAPAGMFVSLPPWAVARNVGWPEQARLAARVGYKGIDWPFGPVRTGGVEATRALLAELSIVPTIVNLPMRDPLGADDAAFGAQLPKLDEDAAFCRAIGCRRFQFVLSPTTLNGQTKAERWALVQRRLAAI